MSKAINERAVGVARKTKAGKNKVGGRGLKQELMGSGKLVKTKYL